MENQKLNSNKPAMSSSIVDLLINTLMGSTSKEDKGIAKQELRKLAIKGLELKA